MIHNREHRTEKTVLDRLFINCALEVASRLSGCKPSDRKENLASLFVSNWCPAFAAL